MDRSNGSMPQTIASPGVLIRTSGLPRSIESSSSIFNYRVPTSLRADYLPPGRDFRALGSPLRGWVAGIVRYDTTMERQVIGAVPVTCPPARDAAVSYSEP